MLILLALMSLSTAQGEVKEWTAIGPDGGNIAALAIDPLNPNIVFARAPFGLFKSTDGGVSE